MRLLSDILNFLFPRQCVMCGKRLNTSESSICTACFMHLPRTDIRPGRQNSRLEKLFWNQIPIERASSFFMYSGDDVRHAIHYAKYKDRPDVAYDLARVAVEEIMPTGFFDTIDCIVPVPIHWIRKLKRHYNQSLCIADGISRETGIPVLTDVVVRTVNNVSQTHLRFSERRKNTENIFKLIDGSRITGKHILLVDDVITSGETIASCAKELAGAGDVRISLFSLARAKSGGIMSTGDYPVDVLVVGLPLMD